jgi:hypothetical protein
MKIHKVWGLSQSRSLRILFEIQACGPEEAEFATIELVLVDGSGVGCFRLLLLNAFVRQVLARIVCSTHRAEKYERQAQGLLLRYLSSAAIRKVI